MRKRASKRRRGGSGPVTQLASHPQSKKEKKIYRSKKDTNAEVDGII